MVYGRILYNNIREYTPTWFKTIHHSRTMPQSLSMTSLLIINKHQNHLMALHLYWDIKGPSDFSKHGFRRIQQIMLSLYVQVIFLTLSLFCPTTKIWLNKNSLLSNDTFILGSASLVVSSSQCRSIFFCYWKLNDYYRDNWRSHLRLRTNGKDCTLLMRMKMKMTNKADIPCRLTYFFIFVDVIVVLAYILLYIMKETEFYI